MPDSNGASKTPVALIVGVIVALVLGGGLFAAYQSPWWQDRNLSDCAKAMTGIDADDVIARCSANDVVTAFRANPDRSFGFFSGAEFNLNGDRDTPIGTEHQDIAIAAFCRVHAQTTGLCADAPKLNKCERTLLSYRQSNDPLARYCESWAQLENADVPVSDSLMWTDADGSDIYVSNLSVDYTLTQALRVACREGAGLATDPISIYENYDEARQKYGSYGAGVCRDIAAEGLTLDEIDEGYKAKKARVAQAESLLRGLGG